jgi:peptidoglycan endopeptidase LytE
MTQHIARQLLALSLIFVAVPALATISETKEEKAPPPHSSAGKITSHSKHDTTLGKMSASDRAEARRKHTALARSASRARAQERSAVSRSRKASDQKISRTLAYNKRRQPAIDLAQNRLNEAKALVAEYSPSNQPRNSLLTTPDQPARFGNRFTLADKSQTVGSPLSGLSNELPGGSEQKPVANTTEYARLQETAYSFLGARYVFGGDREDALDCSSFTQQVFRKMGINLPRTAREQFAVGQVVQKGDLQKGDLLFFETYAPGASHVGIYIGDRKMVHASSADHAVVVSSLDQPRFLSKYIGARRMSNDLYIRDTAQIDDLVASLDKSEDAPSTSAPELN